MLESCGYHVSTASDLSGIPRAKDTAPFDLLILCHSVAEIECEFVKVLSVSRWPTIRTLVLLAGPSGCLDTDHKMFDVYDGPAKLLSVVHAQVDSRYS